MAKTKVEDSEVKDFFFEGSPFKGLEGKVKLETGSDFENAQASNLIRAYLIDAGVSDDRLPEKIPNALLRKAVSAEAGNVEDFKNSLEDYKRNLQLKSKADNSQEGNSAKKPKTEDKENSESNKTFESGVDQKTGDRWERTTTKTVDPKTGKTFEKITEKRFNPKTGASSTVESESSSSSKTSSKPEEHSNVFGDSAFFRNAFNSDFFTNGSSVFNNDKKEDKRRSEELGEAAEKIKKEGVKDFENTSQNISDDGMKRTTTTEFEKGDGKTFTKKGSAKVEEAIDPQTGDRTTKTQRNMTSQWVFGSNSEDGQQSSRFSFGRNGWGFNAHSGSSSHSEKTTKTESSTNSSKQSSPKNNSNARGA